MDTIEQNLNRLIEFFEKIDMSNNLDEFITDLLCKEYHINHELYKYLLIMKKNSPNMLNIFKNAILETIYDDNIPINQIRENYNRAPTFLIDYVLKNIDDEFFNENQDKINDEIENNKIILNKFKWRDAQLRGLEELRRQNYQNGILSLIMGSGKGFMILRTFYDRQKNPIEGKHVYILTTYRLEIINSFFRMPEFEYRKFRDVINNIFKEKDTRKQKLLALANKEQGEILNIVNRYINFPKNYNIMRNKIFASKYDTLKEEQQKLYSAWKINGIINMDDFVLVDAVNTKKRDELFQKLDDNTKPILLIINNSFFQILDFTKYIPQTNILIIDECHSVSAPKFFSKVMLFKNGLVPVIGFSATPIRDTNESKKNLLALFSDNNNKLNIITNYNLFDAIKDDIIVPFQYHLLQSPTSEISSSEIQFQVFDEKISTIIDELPFKKIIGWVKSERELKEWANYLNQDENKYLDLFVSSSFDKKYTDCNTSLEQFKSARSQAILLCIHKCKEGFDVPNVDCGIQLSPVEKRSISVSLQMAGRVMRTCEGKQFATIIDFYLKDGKTKIEELTVNKILDYYASLLNLSDNEIEKDKIQQYLDLYNSTIIIEEENKIILQVDNKKNHNCEIIIDDKMIDWSIFQARLKRSVLIKLKIDKETEFNRIINIVKGYFNEQSDFWKEYNNLNHKILGIPVDIGTEFKEIWDVKTWYDVLGYKTKCMSNILELKKFILSNKLKITCDKDYYNYNKIYEELPPNPYEFFRTKNFRGIIKEFGLSKRIQ